MSVMMNADINLKNIVFVTVLMNIFLGFCLTIDTDLFDTNLNQTNQMYTLAKSNSFIRIDTNNSWNIMKPREVVFQFKTDRPHGLLCYQTVVNPTPGFPVYEIYVMLENGRLKMIHEFGSEQKSFHIGQGLNHDQFHTVKLTINPINGSLTVLLDNLSRNHKKNGNGIELNSLANYIQRKPQQNIASVLYFGGTDSKKPIGHQQHSIRRFVGCLGKIRFRTLTTNELSESVTNATKYRFLDISNSDGLQTNCLNLCKKLDLCANNAHCISHYTYTSCDCFGTKREDWHCRSHNISSVTLRGYSFVSYKLYDYKDRVHSDVNRISLHMKSQTQNQILVYARGEQPLHNYIAIHLRNGILNFEMDLGGGPINASIDNIILSDNKWHNITVKHRSKNINLFIDNNLEKSLQLPGSHHHLHVDPEIFFGGVPTARFRKELVPFNVNYKFVGCLKFVYFNTINILYELNQSNKLAHYHSLFEPEFGCSVIDPIPITMSTKKSHFIIRTEKSRALKITLEFKSEKSEAIFASGSLRESDNSTDKYWFLHLDNSEAKFTISSSNSSLKPLWTLSSGVKHLLNFWQQISLESDGNGTVSIVSNYKHRNQESVQNLSVEYFNSNVSFGAGFIVNSSAIEGLRGCLRDISINNIQIDPRIIYSKYAVIGKISLDNCQLVDPCNSPHVCEHGGKCIPNLETGTTRCDCDKTGYVGKTCHFSLYKRTCEELYLAGYQKTGIYKIDIDRNGPLAPAHVICSMSEDGMIETIIEHNIKHQVVVRERGTLGNFYLNITYREFSPEMLNSLIKHSKQCSQYIKYECNSAPLGLSSYTWMQSTEPGHKVTSIGSGESGRCRCWSAQNCFDRTKHCNCDSETIGWKHDDGTFTNVNDVGITRMFFLQNKNLKPDSEAHLILGNVSCINSNTREYEITFQTKESYLEVSGWEGGDMAVSFRTTATKAVIFYQSPLHSHHGYFKAVLSGEYEITFEFLVNNSPRTVKLKSGRRLNTGEWQQIWVDSDAHHMRFTVNVNSELFDLEDDDEFNGFEGPLYVGGAPKQILKNSEVRTGFIGCLRGLVLNDRVVNLYKHLYRKSTNIEKGCRPFCRPDLCKNGATCVELWGSYECKCANPISQTGRHCETDINSNSMTFVTPSSYYQKLAEGKDMDPILEKDIIISFRTHMTNALIFYANDYNNNFVQLHIENGTHVVFTFNTFDRVVRGAVQVVGILTSGNPIQIKVDRSQRRKTILTANDASIIIDHPIKFLSRYSQKPWKSGDEFELVKPARPPVPIEAHSQLFLGGVDEVGATSQIQGIVGCLQGFVVGEKQFDLMAAAKEPSTVAIGQIKPGCNMLCDRIPCLNGGACTEDWKNDQFHCNCSMTSYGGQTCNKDVGARFSGDSLVRYTFEKNDNRFDWISVHLAFSTDRKSNSGRTILVFIHSMSSTFIHISLMADQSILVQEINDHSKYWTQVVMNEEVSFADGNRHWLLYTRKGKTAQLIVDSEIHDLTFESNLYSNDIESEDSMVLVGAVNPNDKRFENFTNFVGCVSNVLIELNELKIEPLESAFGGRTDLAAVRVEGDIKQGLCAEFKIHVPVITSPGNALNEINSIELDNELWLSPPEPKLVPFKTSSFYWRTNEQPLNKTPIYITCVGFLSIVIFFVSLYMWNLQRNYKIRRFQGETPFFHSKRNSNSRSSREIKFNLSNEDNEAAVKLLQHQELPANGTPYELHPMQETNSSEKMTDSMEKIQFKPESNELESINEIIESTEDLQPMTTSRVRFADST